jgi:RNA recognition motif-containing protein
VELDHKNESRGFGFVCFKDKDSAKACLDEANANKIKVDNEEL